MSVGVVGASGFVGRHLCRYLAEWDCPYLEIQHTQPITTEIIEKCSRFVWVAGVNRPRTLDPRCTHEREPAGEFIQGNVLSWLDFLGRLQTHGRLDKKIVFLSSTRVYGWRPGPCSETAEIVEPDPVYGQTKFAAEQILRLMSRNHIILRAPNLYGSGGRPYYNSVIATWLHLIERGEPLRVNCTGKSERHYTYVSDVCAAIYRCLVEDYQGTYNVGSPTRYSLDDVVAELGKYHNFIVLRDGAPPISEPIINMTKALLHGVSLGWTSLTDGIRQTIQESTHGRRRREPVTREDD